MFGKSRIFVAASVLALGATGALAQNQEGLVNLSVDGNTVQVPIDVAANVCGLDVNVLAGQVGTSETACEISQATAAENNIDTGEMAGGGDKDDKGGKQRGLVNISVDGNTVQVPIGIAANVCDVDANVLAKQKGSSDTVCDISQETAAENGIGPDGKGGKNKKDGGDQEGLVNVSVDGNTVQVPVGVAANVCDLNVNALSNQVGKDKTVCEIDQETAAENGIGQ